MQQIPLLFIGLQNAQRTMLKLFDARERSEMKKGYSVVAYRAISDESATKAYGEVALPAVE